MNAKAKEAFPILKRRQHVFKIVTLYVVDKFNFKLMKKLKDNKKMEEYFKQEGLQSNARRESSSEMNEYKLGDQKDTNINQAVSGQTFASEVRQNLLTFQRFKRRANSPNKQNPTHFNHGDRNVKNCLVCEGKQKQSNPKNENQHNQLVKEEKKDEHKMSQKEQQEKNQIQKHVESLPENTSQNAKQAPSVDGSDILTLQLPQPNVHLQKTLSTKKQNQAHQGSPNKRDQDIEEFWKRRIQLDDFLQGTPTISLTFSKHVKKFNRELLKATCQVIGCKPINANQIAEGVFDEMNQILNNLSENVDFEDHFDLKTASEQSILFNIPSENTSKTHYPQIQTVTTSGPLFKYILQKYLEKYKYQRPEFLKDFYIASDLVQQKRNIIMLLSGTSGTGKSTLASLLGSRLGISTVLSTDTIRHIMRNFVSKEDDPLLFASTYETASFAPEDVTSEKKRTLIGYKGQCNKVLAELEKVIEEYHVKNESLVVEGVHLTVRFMVNMMKKYPSCIPFVVCIKNEEKHKERFAVRTKHMTIDPRYNKYIKHVKNIRIIQKHLIKKAEAALIPRIDNSNVDKSIGLIHVTIVRCLRQIAEGGQIFDAQRKQATGMHSEFNLISKNQLSSRDAQQLIHSKVNKNEILELYMQKANPQIEDRLKNYKRASSMIDMKTRKKKKKGQEANLQNAEEEENERERSPKAQSIHVILRPDEEENKISDMEKKNIKKRFISEFQQFPADEEGFEEDSKAAKLAASQMPQQKPKKADKKEKKMDQEEIRIRDEKKRQSDQQKQIEEEKLQTAIIEAQKKMKEEQEKQDAEEIAEAQKVEKEKQERQAVQEQISQKDKLEQILQQLETLPKSQSLNIEKVVLNRLESGDSSEKKKKNGQNNQSFEVDFLDESEDVQSQKIIPKKASPSKFKPNENEDDSNIELKKFDSIKQMPEKKIESDQDEQKIDVDENKSKVKTVRMQLPDAKSTINLIIKQEENKSERSSDGGSSEQNQEYRSAGRVPVKESTFKPEGVVPAQQKREKSFAEKKFIESKDQTISLKNQNVKDTETPDKKRLRGEYQFSTKIPHLKDGKRRGRLFGNLIGGIKKKKPGLQQQHSFQGLLHSNTPLNKSTSNLTKESPQDFNQSNAEFNKAASNESLLLRQQITAEQAKHDKLLKHQHENTTVEDTQSIYSGNSGLASLVSQSIDYFQVVENYDDNHSAKLQEESGESGDSDDTNSLHADASDHDTINEVSYSQSTISDHEDEQEDVILAKEASFNNKALLLNQSQQNTQNQEGSPTDDSQLLQQQQQQLPQIKIQEQIEISMIVEEDQLKQNRISEEYKSCSPRIEHQQQHQSQQQQQEVVAEEIT